MHVGDVLSEAAKQRFGASAVASRFRQQWYHDRRGIVVCNTIAKELAASMKTFSAYVIVVMLANATFACWAVGLHGWAIANAVAFTTSEDGRQLEVGALHALVIFGFCLAMTALSVWLLFGPPYKPPPL